MKIILQRFPNLMIQNRENNLKLDIKKNLLEYSLAHMHFQVERPPVVSSTRILINSILHEVSFLVHTKEEDPTSYFKMPRRDQLLI